MAISTFDLSSNGVVDLSFLLFVLRVTVLLRVDVQLVWDIDSCVLAWI